MTLPRSALVGMGATRSASSRITGMARMSQCESIVNVNFLVGSNHDVGRRWLLPQFRRATHATRLWVSLYRGIYLSFLVLRLPKLSLQDVACYLGGW